MDSIWQRYEDERDQERDMNCGLTKLETLQIEYAAHSTRLSELLEELSRYN